MNTLEKLIQNVSERHHNKIKKMCEPLVNHFGIRAFTYLKIKNDGNFYFVGNHVEWMEYYYSEKLYLKQPHFRHPANFQSGVSLCKLIENEEYAELCTLASEKFNVNFAACLLNKTNDGLEIVGLDANSPSKLHDIKILNDLKLIKAFVNNFKENTFFKELLEENQVDLKSLIGTKFETAETPIMKTLTEPELFLREIGIDLPKLSVKEKEVLLELLNGYSANEIGHHLHRSTRTIEHHLVSLKNKLTCFSKSELILKARELDSFGFFDTF